ncbi:hypothetical protein B0A48_10716 [Cryoendolithus antarcticus]|uniref:Fungal N-terminal domain-containing protein n=1 Tax=Cryoendolithus antarcticus TaxID=1507870 RepID=A0A1V8SY78_9PEZI|nr:hypothetical protein B0A48_10716 [Cryoendolithus antarcticus]
MELVGVAGSVGGLLGLADQCIEDAVTLRTFWQDIKAASNTAANFLNDLNSLIQTLTDIKKLLESVRDEPALRDCGLDAVTLRLHLEGCDGELRRWIATARKSRPDNGKGVKHWFKSFIIAIDKESLRDIRREIQSRRQCLDLALGVLGRALDAQLLDVLHALQARHDELDMKLDTISQSSFTSHPSLRSTASAPLSASRLTIDNGNGVRDSHNFVSWKLPAWSDNGSVSDQRSQGSGTSQHSMQYFRGRRTSLRGSPRPSTPFRRRSPSKDQPQYMRDAHLFTGTTGDQTPDHDSHWTDESVQDDRPLLQRHYWDAAMLCQWTDGRDRINKWMLHSLGVDANQAAFHQQAIEDELNSQGLSVDEVLAAGGSWERLAFQYWLIDEAAFGIDMLQPPTADTIPSLGPPSLRTDRSSQKTFEHSASPPPASAIQFPETSLRGNFATKAAVISPPDSSNGSDDGVAFESRGQMDLRELQEAVRAIDTQRAGSPAVGNKPLQTRSGFYITNVPIEHETTWDEDDWVSSQSDDYSMPLPMHVRKESGELVKSALRPAHRRRYSSIPGTPTYSKPIAISAGTSPVEQYDTLDVAEKVLGAEKPDAPAVVLKQPKPAPPREHVPPTVDMSLDTAQPALDSQEYRELIEKYCFFGSAKPDPPLCVAAVADSCVVALVAEPDREGDKDVARDVAGLVLEAGTASNELDDVDLAAAAADAPTAPERVVEVEGAAVAEGVPVPVWTWPLGAV